MRSFRELGAIRGQKGNLEAWLFRIAGNVVTDHYRKRAVSVRFPFGHAVGEPGNRIQQRRVLLEALKPLAEAKGPEVRFLSHLKWRRTDYAMLPLVELPGGTAVR